jgi:hypothetical protein
MMRNFKLLLTVVLLTACSPKPIEEVKTWTIDNTYYGNGHVYELHKMPETFVDPVYRVNHENELVLLVMVNLKTSPVTLHYISDTPLDLQKVFNGLKALLSFRFRLDHQTLSLTQKETVIDTIDQISITFENADRQNIETYAQEWSAQIIESQDVRQTVTQLHDLVVERTKYDRNFLSIKNQNLDLPSYHALGVFRDGVAVCSGYSKAFQALMIETEIPSLLIESRVMDHSWNMVYVDGAWLNVDTTKDDPVGKIDKILQDYLLMDAATLESKGYVYDNGNSKSMTFAEIIALIEVIFPQTNGNNEE